MSQQNSEKSLVLKARRPLSFIVCSADVYRGRKRKGKKEKERGNVNGEGEIMTLHPQTPPRSPASLNEPIFRLTWA
jgi:hypothetical protein